MNILISGVAGFLGSNLADAIPEQHRVVGIDNLMRGDESTRNLNEIDRTIEFVPGDIRRTALVRQIIHDEKIDLIYHLAALPSHRLALTKPPLDYAIVDLFGTLNILDAVRVTGARIVFASSNKVYGHQPIPFREDMPKEPEGPYGQAKASAEDYCYQFSKYHGVSSVAIRFHHAVGRRCHSELVLPIFVERALTNADLIANGRYVNGFWKYCAADFTNVADVVRGLLLFMDQNNPLWKENYFDVFNFGTGEMNTVCELANLVLDEIGESTSRIFQGTAMEHEGIEHLADVKKAKEELGWEAKVPLKESVRQYVEWRRRF